MQCNAGLKNEKDGYESLIDTALAISRIFSLDKQSEIVTQALERALPSYILTMVSTIIHDNWQSCMNYWNLKNLKLFLFEQEVKFRIYSLFVFLRKIHNFCMHTKFFEKGGNFKSSLLLFLTSTLIENSVGRSRWWCHLQDFPGSTLLHSPRYFFLGWLGRVRYILYTQFLLLLLQFRKEYLISASSQEWIHDCASAEGSPAEWINKKPHVNLRNIATEDLKMLLNVGCDI